MSAKKKISQQEVKIIRKIVSSNLKKKDLEITEEEILFFKNNPLELDRLTSTAATKKIFLVIAVVIGFIMVAISIIVESFYSDMSEALFNGLLTELLFETGVALWGAAITVYLLEIVLHRQELLNRQYRHMVQRQIKKLEDSNSN